MNRSRQRHDRTVDSNAKTDKRIARAVVRNISILTAFIILFLAVTSCQQAVQMQDTTIPLQAGKGLADD